jgi:hypothetical protein
MMEKTIAGAGALFKRSLSGAFNFLGNDVGGINTLTPVSS